MPKRTLHLPSKVPLGLVPGLEVADSYDEELAIKEAWVRNKFERFFPGNANGFSNDVTFEEESTGATPSATSSFLEVFASPEKHFRFRTSVSVLRRADCEKLEKDDEGRRWLTEIQEYHQSQDGASNADDASGSGLPSLDSNKCNVDLGHFLLVDGREIRIGSSKDDDMGESEKQPNNLFVVATQPHRVPLTTLSKAINALLCDSDFLVELERSEFASKLGLSCIKLHSTLRFDESDSGFDLHKHPEAVNDESPSSTPPCGLICNFVFATHILFDEIRQRLPLSTDRCEELDLVDRLLDLSGFARQFPAVRFVATAKSMCKTAFCRWQQGVLDGEANPDGLRNLGLGNILLEELDLERRSSSKGAVDPPAGSGTTVCYQQVLNSFSNPNPWIAVSTAQWLRGRVTSTVQNTTETADQNTDQNLNLLELYCGVGSHTMALAGAGGVFRNIVAVEINPSLVEMLKENINLNPERVKEGEFPTSSATVIDNSPLPAAIEEFESDNDGQGPNKATATPIPATVTTVHPVCAPSAAFCRRILKDRHYRGLFFNWVLVDPPREGLDPLTLKLLKESGVENILYVSCNPNALERDLVALNVGGAGDFNGNAESQFELVAMCLLDHFPFSAHVETAVHIARQPRRNDTSHASESPGSDTQMCTTNFDA